MLMTSFWTKVIFVRLAASLVTGSSPMLQLAIVNDKDIGSFPYPQTEEELKHSCGCRMVHCTGVHTVHLVFRYRLPAVSLVI